MLPRDWRVTMRWDNDFAGKNKRFRWYDLLNDNGGLLGYVREDLEDREFIACINDIRTDNKKFNNLEDAKNFILTYYVVEKLEGT